MKKTSYLAFLCCMLVMVCSVFSSCKKDDDKKDDGKKSENSLVGTWIAESFTGTDKETVQTVTIPADTQNYAEATFTETTVTMTVCRAGKEKTSQGKYTVNGDKIVVETKEDGKVETIESTFKLNGDTLVITTDDEVSRSIVVFKRQ